MDGAEGGCLPKTTLLWGKRHHRGTKEAHAASVAPLRSRQREPLRLSLMGIPPSSLVTAAWMGRRGLDVAFARSEPALRCRVVTGREETHSVTNASVGAVQISKTPLRGGHCKILPIFCKGGGGALRTGRCAPLGVSRSVSSRQVMHQEPRTALGRDWVGRNASDALWELPALLGRRRRGAENAI